MLADMWRGPVNTWPLSELVIALLIAVGIIAIAWIVLVNVFGWTPPAWFLKICGIVIGLVIGIIAIRFIAGL